MASIDESGVTPAPAQMALERSVFQGRVVEGRYDQQEFSAFRPCFEQIQIVFAILPSFPYSEYLWRFVESCFDGLMAVVVLM